MASPENIKQILEKGDLKECKEALLLFNKKYEKAQEITFMTLEDKLELWTVIFSRLDDLPANWDICADLLNLLRILCREKQTSELAMTDDRVKSLLIRSGLNTTYGPIDVENLCGMKVLFNMLFQSEHLREMFIRHDLLKYFLQHVDANKKDIPVENMCFLLKTFFITTAICKSTGTIVRTELNGLQILVEFIDKIGNVSPPYDNKMVDLLSEALKIVYNMIHNIFPNCTELKADMFDSKEFTLLCEIARLARRHLVFDITSAEKKIELGSHSVHVLCAVPPECYIEVLNEDWSDHHERILFENTDMAAVEAIVKLAEIKLDASDKSPATPIILSLGRMASHYRKIRKYLKKRILPPLTKADLLERPEIGTSLRNKLCAVIHTPTGNLTDVTANLIFVLCKENVSKMVKYTGYGNAAGLLANRGLMLGGKGNGKYSDSSDESDTEDYLKIKDEINYVEGRIKPEEPPIEMTEEQKEYEAMKLVEAIDKLQECKIIQPCRIGEDGKPKPIEHVLELPDALDNSMKTTRTTSDSDSD